MVVLKGQKKAVGERLKRTVPPKRPRDVWAVVFVPAWKRPESLYVKGQEWRVLQLVE